MGVVVEREDDAIVADAFPQAPFPLGTLEGSTSPTQGSRARSSIARSIRGHMPRGRLSKTRHALLASFTSHGMFSFVSLPIDGVTSRRILYAAADRSGLAGREPVIPIRQSLWADDDHAGMRLDRDKIAHGELEVLADALGDYHLPALSDAADAAHGFSGHDVRLSDRQNLSSPSLRKWSPAGQGTMRVNRSGFWVLRRCWRRAGVQRSQRTCGIRHDDARL